jgi:hypothetical protein
MRTHTPGPWHVGADIGVGRLEINGPDGRTIACVLDLGDSNEERDANAQLIRAAPDLYEALKLVLDDAFQHFCDPINERIIASMRAAVAKVEGRAS